jgi:hypothetical protein
VSLLDEFYSKYALLVCTYIDDGREGYDRPIMVRRHHTGAEDINQALEKISCAIHYSGILGSLIFRTGQGTIFTRKSVDEFAKALGDKLHQAHIEDYIHWNSLENGDFYLLEKESVLYEIYEEVWPYD